MSVLANVTRSAPRLPARGVLYAAEKFGKSSFGAYAPKPIFLMTAGETGLLSLIEAGRVPPTDHFPEDFRRWSDLLRAVKALRDEQHDYKTLVLDTGNGAEILCQQDTCDSNFNGDWADFAAYGRGTDLSTKAWASFLQLLDDVRLKKGMSILILHHAKVKTFSDPAGKSWDQWKPESIEKLWALTHKWSDFIMFGGFKTSIVKEKAVGETRYLHTAASAAIVGGNRYGLPPEITAPPGADKLFKAFATAMANAKSKGASEPTPAKPSTTPEPTPPANTAPAPTADVPEDNPADYIVPTNDDFPDADEPTPEAPEAPEATTQPAAQQPATEPTPTPAKPSTSATSGSLPSVTQKAVLDALHELELGWHNEKAKARCSEIIGRAIAPQDHVSTLSIDEANKLIAAFKEAIQKKRAKAAAAAAKKEAKAGVA